MHSRASLACTWERVGYQNVYGIDSSDLKWSLKLASCEKGKSSKCSDKKFKSPMGDACKQIPFPHLGGNTLQGNFALSFHHAKMYKLFVWLVLWVFIYLQWMLAGWIDETHLETNFGISYRTLSSGSEYDIEPSLIVNIFLGYYPNVEKMEPRLQQPSHGTSDNWMIAWSVRHKVSLLRAGSEIVAWIYYIWRPRTNSVPKVPVDRYMCH